MILCNISLLIVVAFLLLTLAVGCYFSRRKTTFREYAIGNKQFATATLVATVLASNFGGGGMVRGVEMAHHRGLWWIIVVVVSGITYCWISSILALRMGAFMDHLSMPETIGRVYGKYPSVIVALFSTLGYVVAIAGQIRIGCSILPFCLGSAITQPITILFGLILIFYSSFGGVRTILFTDILQLTTFFMIIPLMSCFLFLKTGKTLWEVVSFVFTKEKFQFSPLLNTRSILVMISVILGTIADCVQPTNVQRIYMSSGPIQARSVFRYAILFTLVITCFILSIGVFVFTVASELPLADIWGYLLADLSPILRGLVAICILAMAMSTADSCLNVCAIMVGNDIYEAIRGKKAVSHLQRLQVARLGALFVGLSAMVLSFYIHDSFRFILLALNVSVPVASAPFILAVYGFRSSSRTALIGMATGVLTISVWNRWIEPTTSIDGSFICMVVNGLAMLAAHYLLSRTEGSGWVGPDDAFRQVQQHKERVRRRNKETREALMLSLLVMIVMVFFIGIICALFMFYG